MAPKRRRDEAEKAEEEKDHTTSTKCGLAGLLSEKIEADGVAVTREESLAAVDFLVAALTRLRFEALCLLGLVAVRMCEDARREGQGLQPHCATCRRLRKTELVEDDMYAAICAVSVCDLTEQGRKRGRPSKRDQHPEDDLFRHVCEEHFPRDEEAAGARVNRSGLTPFLPPLSKGVFTNVKNHYAANFAAWLARSFRCRIDDELRENRDVSAANVIRVLLLLKLMGFERPTKLQRPPWPPAAAGPG